MVRSPAVVKTRGYLVIVRDPRTKEEEKIPIITIKTMIILGKSVALTTAVLDKLLQQKIPIILVTRDTTALIESPHLTTNPEIRWKQYHYLSNTLNKILLARKLIESKIRGYASVARYHARHTPQHAETLRQAAQAAEQKIQELENAKTPQEIMNIEAQASQEIWKALRQTKLAQYQPTGFNGRNPRSKDPINQSLNYLHAILYSIAYRALIASGLDPHLGILHREGYGKTPMVYDYTEQFKPIALHTLITASTKTKLKLNRTGLLTRKTIEQITRQLYKNLNKGQPPPHKQIYTKAWELRNTIKTNTIYKPYIYILK